MHGTGIIWHEYAEEKPPRSGEYLIVKYIDEESKTPCVDTLHYSKKYDGWNMHDYFDDREYEITNVVYWADLAPVKLAFTRRER